MFDFFMRISDRDAVGVCNYAKKRREKNEAKIKPY